MCVVLPSGQSRFKDNLFVQKEAAMRTYMGHILDSSTECSESLCNTMKIVCNLFLDRASRVIKGKDYNGTNNTLPFLHFQKFIGNEDGMSLLKSHLSQYCDHSVFLNVLDNEYESGQIDSAEIVGGIEARIDELLDSGSERLLFPGGWHQQEPYSSHHVLIVLDKVEDDRYEVKVINTAQNPRHNITKISDSTWEQDVYCSLGCVDKDDAAQYLVKTSVSLVSSFFSDLLRPQLPKLEVDLDQATSGGALFNIYNVSETTSGVSQFAPRDVFSDDGSCVFESLRSLLKLYSPKTSESIWSRFKNYTAKKYQPIMNCGDFPAHLFNHSVN